jgi:N,N'-diacetyllegionaminate synthase
MKSKNFYGLSDTFIVAEIGNNHEGNFHNAKKLIDKAAEAKVDAVKFQTFKTENFVSTSIDNERKKKLDKFQLTMKEFTMLSNYAKKKKLVFFSTPLDIESCNYLNKIQPIFKISSGDNNYTSLINKILKFKKPTIISTGMTNLKDLKKLDTLIKNKKFKAKLCFLHCVSSYPATFKELNLNSISFLKNKFPNYYIGYSDHSTGIEACINAAALGAKVIEKHFTLSHNFSNFRDHQLSANPIEMKEMVRKIRNIAIMKGKVDKKITKTEQKNQKALRRSLAANKTLNPGHIIKNCDLIMLRPANGFKDDDRKLVIGKKVKQIIKKNEIILRRKLN